MHEEEHGRGAHLCERVAQARGGGLGAHRLGLAVLERLRRAKGGVYMSVCECYVRRRGGTHRFPALLYAVVRALCEGDVHRGLGVKLRGAEAGAGPAEVEELGAHGPAVEGEREDLEVGPLRAAGEAVRRDVEVCAQGTQEEPAEEEGSRAVLFGCRDAWCGEVAYLECSNAARGAPPSLGPLA